MAQKDAGLPIQHMPKTKRDRTKTLTYLTTFSCALAIGSLVFSMTSVGTSQTELSKLKADTIPVVVATQPITPGTTIKVDSLSVVDVPKTYAATDALASLENALGKVAVVSIPANGQLTTSSIAGLPTAATLALALEPGEVAASVSVDAQTGVGGLLRQGDFVDILSEGSVIVEHVRVLALDASLAEQTGEYATVTVEVSVEQAGMIQDAQANSEVRLVLHAEADKAPASELEVR